MFDSWFPKGWSTMEQLMWLYRIIKGAASWTWKTVSGALIHVTDALAVDVSALSVTIDPVQDLHGYDHPWPAGGGVNKMPAFAAESKTLGTTTCSMDGNGTFTLKAVSDATARTFTFDITPFTTPASGYLHLLNSAASNGVTMSFRDANDDAIGSSFAFSVNANKIIELGDDRTEQLVSKIRVYKNAATTDIELTFSPMLLATNTATPYVPYSNICPISGWTQAKVTRTGKNLIRLVESEMTVSSWNARFPFFIKAGSYVISCQNQIHASDNTKPGLRLTFYDSSMNVVKDVWDNYAFGNGTLSGSLVFSKAEAERISIIELRPKSAGVTYQNIADGQIMLEVGPTATAYEAYTGTTLTIDLDGTIYGGTLDVLTGVLTVTRKSYVFAGNENWTINAQGNAVCVVSDMVKGNTTDGICDKLKTGTQAGNIRFGASANNNSVYIVSAETAYGLDTVAKVQAFTAGMQICYRLATPQTVQLDPAQLSTLAGENNVWADTGNITMTYMADGETETIEALNLLLGNRYTPAQTEDDVPDKEALQIITGGTR